MRILEDLSQFGMGTYGLEGYYSTGRLVYPLYPLYPYGLRRLEGYRASATAVAAPKKKKKKTAERTCTYYMTTH